MALGSGGAKGFAELGALKAFEENGIEFDVTGLSPISLGWKKEVAPAPTPTPEATLTPTPTVTPAASTVPNTSDNSNMMMWALVAIVSLIVAIAVTVARKFQLMK